MLRVFEAKGYGYLELRITGYLEIMVTGIWI